MTNDQLARIERWIATGQRLGNHDAKALLEQLRSNTADMVRVRKRLADAERDLELLAKVRAHSGIDQLVDSLHGEQERMERLGLPDVAAAAEALIALLSPGDAGRGEGT